jgi:hypothetical protein
VHAFLACFAGSGGALCVLRGRVDTLSCVPGKQLLPMGTCLQPGCGEQFPWAHASDVCLLVILSPWLQAPLVSVTSSHAMTMA